MDKLKLGIAGTGYLSRIVVDAWKNGLLEEYELVGVFGRNAESAGKMAEDDGCKACNSVDALLELKPDYIAEAASVSCVKDMAVKVLSAGTNLVVLSIGAFADLSLIHICNISQCKCKSLVWLSVRLTNASFFQTSLKGMDFTTCAVSYTHLSKSRQGDG